MKIKVNIFLVIIMIYCVSCSTDFENVKDENLVLKRNVNELNFSTIEEMEDKILQITLKKREKEIAVLKEYENSNKELMDFQKLQLKSIYELRKEFTFVSIQSIAEEINYLVLVDKKKSDSLFNEHKKFLVKKITGVETIFSKAISEVINKKGEVFVNDKLLSFDMLSSQKTSKYIGDESIKSGVVGNYQAFYVYYFVGREIHTNDLGIKFFKYFTEFKGYILTVNGLIPCPTIYDVDTSSIAGFVQTQDIFFSDYSFSMGFPSGFNYGVSVRNVGGNKNTPYKPAGGNIKGQFITQVENRQRGFFVDMKYVE